MKARLYLVMSVAICAALLSGCGLLFRVDKSNQPNGTVTSTSISVLPPVMVDPLKGDQAIAVTLDKTVDFNVEDPEAWKGEVSNPNIATFNAGENRGTWTANPSLELHSPGTTAVTLSHNGAVAAVITLTVNDETMNQMDKTLKETQVVADQSIGKSEQNAVTFIESHKTSTGENMSSRIGRRDSENFALTMDYRPSRITLEIDNGVVTKATVG